MWTAPTRFTLEWRGFAAGLATAFFGCCLAGWTVSRMDVLGPVPRFHAYLQSETLFFPTASSLREMVRARARPDQTLVLIGGNSVLEGAGQAPEELWSLALQAELGESFAVVNLAQWAAQPPAIAPIVAESLVGEYRRLLLVVSATGAGCGPPDGGSRHRHVFWDAWAKGMLLPFPERDRFLASYADASPEDQPSLAETRREMLMNRAFFFADLWHFIGYRYLFTVWHRYTKSSFWRPRSEFPDEDGMLASRRGPNPPEIPQRVDQYRNLSGRLMRRRADGSLEAVGQWKETLAAQAAVAVHPALRRRTLLLLTAFWPVREESTTAEGRRRVAAVTREAARVWDAAGYRALDLTDVLEGTDMIDNAHLWPSGGRKLAGIVAPELRSMASALDAERETDR